MDSNALNNALRKLGVAKALQKEIGKYVDAYRAVCDAELDRMFEESGGTADRLSVVVGGQKVGELIVNRTSESREERIEVTDWDALEEWEFSQEMANAYVVRNIEDFCRWYFAETGEKPDGCDLVEHTTPGGKLKNTSLRGCTATSISKALGVPLGNEVKALLLAGD